MEPENLNEKFTAFNPKIFLIGNKVCLLPMLSAEEDYL